MNNALTWMFIAEIRIIRSVNYAKELLDYYIMILHQLLKNY